MPETVYVNGAPVEMPPNASAAAAVGAAGGAAPRRSVTGQPRGPLCGMGICFECRATIDGEPHGLSCQTPCTPGLNVVTDQPEASATATHQPSLTLPARPIAEQAFDVL